MGDETSRCPLCDRSFPSREELNRHDCAVLPGETGARPGRSVRAFTFPYLALVVVTLATLYLLVAKHITGHWDPAPDDWGSKGAELALYSLLVFCWWRYPPFQGRIYKAAMMTVTFFVWISFWAAV